ncbi:MAG: PASTA domain-containing protein [Cyclobacteriaceae bacterium]|nr:PASTA domain-containing protein [Cyclobacteriaceae bacterium]
MLEKYFRPLTTPSWKTLAIHIALILLVMIVIIMVFFYAYLPSTTRHGETITVPNLEGMSLNEMDDFLKRRNLNYEVADSNYFEKYPALAILKQYPLPGAYVKEGRKIYLTINKNNPELTIMPDLIDGSLKNAELVLQNAGLKRGKITYKPDLAPNAVLEQWYGGEVIEAGAKVAMGSEIDLVVGDGLGQRVFSVPRFIGLPIDEADFSVKASGLTTGSVIVKIINNAQKEQLLEIAAALEIDTVSILKSGHVFRQRPEIGTDIRLGQQVDLWVVSLDEEDSIRVVDNWVNKAYEELSPTGESYDQ